MGAYLSTPRTEKDSSDEKYEDMVCGASSMQGWRINQEDAHNCELNFDKDASFFAVYDGHGGPEIALYCSKFLPAFLKTTDAYARGDFEQALRDAFLGFDSKLLGPDVIEELKQLAGDKYGYGEDEADEDSDEDLAELKQEGGMPIEEVLTKYRNIMKNHPLARIRDEEPGGSAGGSSSSTLKPQSPSLRGKKQALTGAAAENGGSSAADAEKPSGSTGEDEAVSSSSAAAAKADGEAEPTSTAEEKVTKDGGDADETKKKPTVSKPMESPDSSSTDANKVGNSDAAVVEGSSPSKAPAANDVSSSISSSSGNNVAEAGGSSSSTSAAVASSAGGSSSSGVNGESSSSSPTSGSISSTNVERAAKRVAMAINDATPEDSDDSDEDERDMTYDENNSDDDEEDLEGEEDEDEEDDDDDDDEEGEEEEEDDGFISNMVEEPGKDSGCTAVVAFRHGRNLYVANAGDSRCVLSRSGKAIEMSFDHKPEDTEEYERITKAGGRVTLDGRVNGGLNLSRAIGDHAYKMNTTLTAAEQMISAKPDIKKIELTDEDDFMVLACDGIWNFMSSEAVIQFVKARLDKEEGKLSKICEELFDHCLAKDTHGDGTGCDNMTAIIVRFKWTPKDVKESCEAAPVLEVGLKRAASSSPLPVPEISEAEADGGLKAKRAKTDVEDAQAPTTTST